ncbi:hypothetical protein F4802DRAFT_595107 [Xylaria palmicola]|nr:hypothetical protein F4802DRAFT_595107 [Xylaria palmicola]
MYSPPPQNEDDDYLLPSTYSPWRHEEPGDLPDSNSRSTTPGWQDSPNFYMPQSVNVPSPTTVQEPPTTLANTAPPLIVLSPSTNTGSTVKAETVSSLHSSELGRHFSMRSVLATFGLSPSTEQRVPIPSAADAGTSAAMMPTQPGAASLPMPPTYSPLPSPSSMASEGEGDRDNLSPRYNKPYMDCYSRQDVYVKRWSWLYVTLIFLSIYSTAFSALWFAVSVVQPQYGRSVSTGPGWQIVPSTATLLATLAAKTIELSFVTVFVAVLGQVLTRRAFSRLSRGVTLAEMTMRNWVIQPGSLLTHCEGIPSAATTFLGALTLTATICALFYTTASDAMISPKLTRQGWVVRDLQGLVKASYSNVYYILDACQTPLRSLDVGDEKTWRTGCLDILFSGQSYQSLTAFLTEWDDIHTSQNGTMAELSDRPTGKHNLFDNTTMDSSWIETENGDMEKNFEIHKRVINNVTLAMPHAGVYSAATDPINYILQPNELQGLGEYSIKASVVSPVVNVMCVNMNEEELAPLVYTTWPNARTNSTAVLGQRIGANDWYQDISPEWYNRTVVDDIFKWNGQPDNQRPPPAFQLYPNDYNMITNKSVAFSDPLYILAKSGALADYTLCELRSWVTPKCSTRFDLSGTSGGYMKAHCEDPDDMNAYERTDATTPPPTGDWLSIADEWGLSMDLNALLNANLADPELTPSPSRFRAGGVQNNNASNARALTRLILDEPALDPLLPSLAEALAVYVSSTLVIGSLDSTFKSEWTHEGVKQTRREGVYETIRAEVQTQQYASAHTAAWQVIFYPVLGLTFLLNVLCLLYLVAGTAFASLAAPRRSSSPSSPRFPFLGAKARGRTNAAVPPPWAAESDSENDGVAGLRRGGRRKAAKGLVTDYTEPQNLFALAVNSPPSRGLAGSCGHGPDAGGMAVPWRVGYAAGANHYFFEEGRVVGAGDGTTASGADLLDEDADGRYGQSYKRLSSRRPWL